MPGLSRERQKLTLCYILLLAPKRGFGSEMTEQMKAGY